ncbi:hypothetical protein ElyMa_002366800 [Elysia marginata]|uniref:Uncharacterized protein n=1 Tax=Elysia marginata TaxID=1093978 RepID=A0AAV4GD74_9GAST|nr:hypothetical protein ElyMa_002366800 [Elysia marginata]
MKLTENSVQQVLQPFQSFTNNFDIVGNDIDKLISLSSGMEATEKVTTNLLTIEKLGKKLFHNFIQTRLVDKDLSFHEPLQKNKITTSANQQQKTVRTQTTKKSVEKIIAQRDLFGQLLLLSTEDNLDLQKVMEYLLGPIAWASATPNGMPIKTNNTNSKKNKLFILVQKSHNTFMLSMTTLVFILHWLAYL